MKLAELYINRSLEPCIHSLRAQKNEDTLLYVQLAETIFKETTDEFTVRVAKSLDEVCSLLEAGFEYVTDMDDVKLFRKRK